jgi:dihydrolipoamide dehydrogenase
MIVHVKAPSLDDSDTVVVGQWLKLEGATVKKGEVLVEIEAKKSTMEIEASHDGILSKILVAEGETVEANTSLAVLTPSISAALSMETASLSETDGALIGSPGSRSNDSKKNLPTYDVAVIGAGPGGYTAAIRCAQLGLNTVCVESRVSKSGDAALGGTCLNVGCIPSKALLDSSHKYHELATQFHEHGISVAGTALNLSKMMGRKNRIVEDLNKGIKGLFRFNNVHHIVGTGTLLPNKGIRINAGCENQYDINARSIIIATGSNVATIPVAQIDNEVVVDSTGAMSFSSVPQRVAVIGAGAIGLELGSVWHRLGSDVVLFEALDTFLPALDSEISQEAYEYFLKQGLDIRLGTKVTQTRVDGDSVTVGFIQNNAVDELTFDRLIVAVGRRPNTSGLGAEEIGLEKDASGYIKVDSGFRTNLDGVYAIGDVIRGPMLAHKSAHDGVLLAEQLAGRAASSSDRHEIPFVIYTWPEIAWIGQSSKQLQEGGIAYRSGTFPLRASGRALASGEAVGKVKVLMHPGTDEVLGVHMFAPNASELIAEAGVAINVRGGANYLADMIHAHPTLAEAMHEAARVACHNSAIHVTPSRAARA